MKIVLIDYGMGNLGSARRAFEECGAEVLVSENPSDLADADRFVLPGVGAFGDGMAQLSERGWIPRIMEALKVPHIALLGICLGMQLLADKGYEGGENAGLGLIPGEVTRLEPPVASVRIPHIGWNEVHYSDPRLLFANIPSASDFYFVHSYQFVPKQRDTILATTPYCGTFISAVRRGNVFGVQFHPEKSGRPGMQLIRNFLTA